MTKGVRIVHVNTRSIFRKVTLLEELYADCDILCCTGTWLDDIIQENLDKTSNMKIFRCDHECGIRDYNVHIIGGRVCIYVANKWSDYVSLVKEGTTISKDFEIVVLTKSKPNFKKMFIACVHKRPKGRLYKLYKLLNNLVNNFQAKKCEIWILGDFKTDFLKRDNVNVVQTYRFRTKLGLKQVIDQVTRPNRKGGSCIDWRVTDSAFVRESGVLDDFVSDHYTVYCIRKKFKENCIHVTRTVHDYRKNEYRHGYDYML